MSHNLEYLLTRPGALKIATIIFGIVAAILNGHSYADSPYTHFYMEEAELRNSTTLPGTEVELSNMTGTFIFLGISFVYLAAHAFFYALCESRFNKFLDTAFHLAGALLLFAGGATLINSAIQIERTGCPTFKLEASGPSPSPKHFSPLTTILSSFHPGHSGSHSWVTHRGLSALWTTQNDPDDPFCHYFGEKVIGGAFNVLNGILYGILGFVIFTTEVEDL